MGSRPRYSSSMRKRNLSVGLILVAVCAPLALFAQQATTAPVIIRVSDQSGAGIAHAQIRLVPSRDPAPAELETDDRGQCAINLKAGGYALAVSAQGFKNWAESIYIATAAGQPSVSQVVPVLLQIGATGSPVPVYPQDSLVLTADPDPVPLVLSPADFHALPHVTMTAHNSHSNADEAYSGVPLATLLAKVNAPLGKELHGGAMTSYVVATGSDGYSVVISLAEIDPEFHAGQVLVADARDGKPLEKDGPFQLIVSDDKRPARWVHNLVSITLKRGR
jgi:hypothetical protein